MPTIVQTINEDGSVINVREPMSLVEIQAFLKSERQRRRDSRITVGGVLVSTTAEKDAEWDRREKYLLAGMQEFVYVQPGEAGEPIMISAEQAQRIIQCRDWYVNECFVTEMRIWNAAKLAADPDPFADIIANSLYWPIDAMQWIVTQQDIDAETARQVALAQLEA
jgi:hypothetical protein